MLRRYRVRVIVIICSRGGISCDRELRLTRPPRNRCLQRLLYGRVRVMTAAASSLRRPRYRCMPAALAPRLRFRSAAIGQGLLLLIRELLGLTVQIVKLATGVRARLLAVLERLLRVQLFVYLVGAVDFFFFLCHSLSRKVSVFFPPEVALSLVHLDSEHARRLPELIDEHFCEVSLLHRLNHIL